MVRSWEHLKFWKTEYENTINKIFNHCDYRALPSDHTLWFKALELTPFDKVKVVILGQDPYHTKGLAHGLAFSVQPHIKKLPPSLRNILKEYQADLGYPAPRSGDLRAWAERGVLLLNTILTVEEGKPLSHKGLGWEKLTYEIIRSLSERGSVVFVLWGKSAQEYKAACGECPVLIASHPSPLGAMQGEVPFVGSRPFSKTNEELKKLGVNPIDWKL